ncbi:hypothetical protein ACFRJ9_13395 [Paenarthrobacter sp. NPDC056912]|uniref:hypothetical protein n=1 Tax=Paenarthrobacter sp. NPDC056912 TaxID=3345965 RepID=UPI00366D8818
MENVKESLVLRCGDLKRGDVIEGWVSGNRRHRGTVTETMPRLGLFWIVEEQLGERRLLDMNEVAIVRFTATAPSR